MARVDLRVYQMRTAQTEAGSATGTRPAKPLRILIADDEQDTLLTLAAILK